MWGQLSTARVPKDSEEGGTALDLRKQICQISEQRRDSIQFPQSNKISSCFLSTSNVPNLHQWARTGRGGGSEHRQEAAFDEALAGGGAALQAPGERVAL